MPRTRSLLAVLAGMVAAAGARADDVDSTAYTAPVTTVTATRAVDAAADLPLAVSTVDADDIRRGEKGVTLTEALRGVPGLVVQDRQNPSQGERLTARGLGARAAFGVRGVKVLLDGVPLTTPDGTTQLGNVDLGSVARIEVLRGPSSSLYGNAGGGVITIHTESPAAGLRAQPRLVVGSDGLRREQLNLAGGGGRHRLSVNLRQLRLDGFRDHSQSQIRGANLVGHHELAPGWQLTSVVSLYDAPYLLNPSSLSKADAEAHPRMARGFVVAQGASKRARQLQGGLTLQRETEASRTEVTVYGVDRSLDNPIPGAVIDLERSAGGLRAVHDRAGQVAGVPLRWKVGMDLEAQSDARTELDNEGVPEGTDAEDVPDAVVRGDPVLRQDEEVRAWGPFAGVELHPVDGVRLDAGLRLDRTRFEVTDRWTDDGDASGARTMGQWSPSVGVSWRLAPLVHAWAGFATAFQTPTANELGNRADGAGGFNPDLDPESIRSWEAGVRGHWLPGRLDWDLSLYRMSVDDLALPYPVEDPASEAVYYRNAGRAEGRGAELAVRGRPHPRWDLSLAATWMDLTFDDYDLPVSVGGPDELFESLAGNEVPGVPPWQLQGSVVGRGPAGTRAEVEAGWTGGFWADDRNGVDPADADADRDAAWNDDAFRLSLRLSWPLPAGDAGAEAFLGIDNLLDARHNGSVTPNAFGGRYFEPAPGRTWYAGLQLDVGD